MAKFEPIDQISQDFAEVIRAEWNGDLAFTPIALKAIGASAYDQVDILEVVEDGVVVDVRKDEPHETLIELTHRTTSGFTLCVTVAFDPHRPGLCVKEVATI